jgi:hypothetical protein
LLRYPITDRGGSHDQNAVSHCLGDRLAFFSLRQQVSGANSRTSFAESGNEGLHEP